MRGIVRSILLAQYHLGLLLTFRIHTSFLGHGRMRCEHSSRQFFLGYTRHNKKDPAVDSFPLQAGAAAQLHRLPFNTHTLASLTVSQAFLSFVSVLCFCNNRISLIPNVNSILGPDSGLRQTLLSLLNSYLAAAYCIGTCSFPVLYCITFPISRLGTIRTKWTSSSLHSVASPFALHSHTIKAFWSP